jgi:hypothetical protein
VQNFKQLLEDTKHLPDVVTMCRDLAVDPETLDNAMNGMGDRMERAHKIFFSELHALLTWGIALGYSYAVHKYAEAELETEQKQETAPKVTIN